MYRSTLLGIMLALSTCISTALAQGQVYLFGQLVASANSVKMPEVAKIKSTIPVITFITKSNPNTIGRRVFCNTASRLQISSATNDKASRRLSAAITSGASPKGTMLKLALNNPENIKGNSGETLKTVILNKSNNILLSDIGTCYSGKGIQDGYCLEYIYEIPAYTPSNVNSENAITVTLTMSAEV